MTIHYNPPQRLKKWSQEKHLSLSLPPVEKNLLSWILKERPSVAGKPRDFALEPFLVDMLEDMHPYIQYVMARQCIEENEYVYAENGVKLVRNLKDGDHIVGGEIHALHSFYDEIYEIKFWNGVKIKVNSEHPFYTEKGWQKPAQLIGQWVQFISGESIRGSFQMGALKAKLFGYLYSDGHWSETQSVSFANNNQSFTLEVVKLAIEVFAGINPTQRIITHNNPKWHPSHQAYLITTRGSQQNPIIDYIREHELLADGFGKIQNLIKEDLIAFLQGYFNGDGCLYIGNTRRQRKNIQLDFAIGNNHQRAVEMQFMLWRLGISSNIKPEKLKGGTGVFYRVTITQINALLKLIPLLDHSKYPHKFKEALEDLQKHPIRKTNLIKKDESGYWVKVRSVIPCGKGKVFGFVTTTHEIYSYLGMRTHNTYKTTSAADMLGWAATNHKMAEVGYVVDSEPRRIAFSKQRLREQVFLHNPKLRQFLPFERANVGDITLLNGTHIYPANDEGGYKNIEGKSLALLVFDEWQYHDMIEQMPKAMYTLFRTHGLFRGFGIGGEAGSEYHKKWMMTDQREWYYDNQDEYQGWSGQGWRKDLLFDDAGNIINSKSELKSILAGHWKATKPENTEFHGYHISQLLYGVIPLTIKDAVEKYHLNPSFSIEWQKKKTYTSTYIAHVLADFYKAERRPITPEMVYACMHPYRHLALLSGQEVLQTKESLGKRIRVLMGVDWGSSVSKPTTVVAIIIKDREFETYRLAWIEKRPAMKEPDQAAYMANLALTYGVDACMGDLGYGETTVPLMQDGGYDTQGNQIPALGRRRMMGCRTIGDETKPEMEYKTKADEHGKQLAHLKIDKTTTIQKFVDFLGWYVEHPEVVDQAKKRPKLIIPFKNDWETDFLVDDFCALTRKDLEKELEIVVEDPRQRARKEFNHPADSMMACIYCMVADENYDEDAYRITGARQRR